MVPGDMLFIPVATPSPLYPSTRMTGPSTTTRSASRREHACLRQTAFRRLGRGWNSEMLAIYQKS